MIAWPVALSRATWPSYTRFLLTAVVALASTHAMGTETVRVDVLSSMQRERVARLGADEAMRRSNASIIRELLVDPASPYSDAKASPDFTNDVDWPDIVRSLPGRRLDSDEAVAMLRWDLGATRARPDVDVPAGPRAGYRDRFIEAGARKADVDADIFWHMLDLTGFRHSTKAASYAVGMQILRGQIAATVADRQIPLGIDAHVFGRVMRATHAEQLRDYDLRYLSTLVQHRLIHWRAGAGASTGLRELPTAFRVARVAAAYRDAEGYVGGIPCRADASPNPGFAGMGTSDDTRPLCFVAATDRAVHRWYLDELRRQATVVPEQHTGGLAMLAGLVGAIFPLLEMASLFEVIEAVIADDLVAAESLTTAEGRVAAERADRLTCHIEE